MAKRPRIFLSYSTKDKLLAGEIKTFLSRYGFSVFLAHEDLRISQEWMVEIRRELRLCAAYLALLTENFRKSDWADQEAGYALSRSKRKTTRCAILPIAVAPIRSPHGFLKSYQALSLRIDDVEGTCARVAEELDDMLGLTEYRKNDAIERFASSKSFRSAKENFRTLKEHQPFSPTQIGRIIEAALENSQIQLPELVTPMRDLIYASVAPSAKRQEFLDQFRILSN